MTPVIYEARPPWWPRHGWKVIRAVFVLLAVLAFWRMVEGNLTQSAEDSLNKEQVKM